MHQKNLSKSGEEQEIVYPKLILQNQVYCILINKDSCKQYELYTYA